MGMTTEEEKLLKIFERKPPVAGYGVLAPETVKDDEGKRWEVDRKNKQVIQRDAVGTSIKRVGQDPLTILKPMYDGIDPKAKATEAPKEEAPAPEAPKVPAPPINYSNGSSQSSSTKERLTVPEYAPDSSVWERALIGATPLLVGLLTGNKLEGAQVASQHVVADEGDRYKRGKDFNQKLAEMAAKRDMASTTAKAVNKFDEIESYNPERKTTELWSTHNGKRYEYLGDAAPDAAKEKFQKVTVWDDKNKAYVEKLIDPASGKEVIAGKAQPKFRDDIKVLPTQTANDIKYQVVRNGESETYLPGTVPQKPAAMNEAGKDDRFHAAQMNRVVEAVRNKNSKFSAAQEDGLNVVKAAEMLNKPNPFSDEGLKTFLARSVFSEKGPLSDSDLNRLRGEGSLSEQAVRNIMRWRDGNRITDADAVAIRQVLETVYPYIRNKAMGEISHTIKAYPQYAAQLGPRLNAYASFPALPAWTNPKRNNVTSKKGVMKTMNEGKPKSIQQGDHVYYLNEKTGQYE